MTLLTPQRLLVAALVVGAGYGTALALDGRPDDAAKAHGAEAYAAFCTPVASEAIVGPGIAAQHHVPVVVPGSAPSVPVLDDATPVRAVRPGEVVEFSVQSPQEGALAVHGLTELALVSRGGTASLRLRAIHTGRFPLHFHGRDGSHFEVAAITVQR